MAADAVRARRLTVSVLKPMHQVLHRLIVDIQRRKRSRKRSRNTVLIHTLNPIQKLLHVLPLFLHGLRAFLLQCLYSALLLDPTQHQIDHIVGVNFLILPSQLLIHKSQSPLFQPPTRLYVLITLHKVPQKLHRVPRSLIQPSPNQTHKLLVPRLRSVFPLKLLHQLLPLLLRSTSRSKSSPQSPRPVAKRIVIARTRTVTIPDLILRLLILRLQVILRSVVDGLDHMVANMIFPLLLFHQPHNLIPIIPHDAQAFSVQQRAHHLLPLPQQTLHRFVDQAGNVVLHLLKAQALVERAFPDKIPRPYDHPGIGVGLLAHLRVPDVPFAALLIVV